MALFDIILLSILGVFVLYGLSFGLIRALGALIGVVFATLIASRIFVSVALFASWIFKSDPNTTRVIVFIILFLVINKLFGFLFGIIEGIFGIVEKLPFVKSLNRLAGGFFGFIEGIFTIGAILYVASRYDMGPWFMGIMAESSYASWFMFVGDALQIFVPNSLKMIQPFI